ncbi:hypothetical protein [Streptomyces sp. NPDC002619]|uniref:hypothetical protein n=1 Tax=Streptomyces sp. NPDC002619 TaxID=3364655 RepID=UPI0036C23CCB
MAGNGDLCLRSGGKSARLVTALCALVAIVAGGAAGLGVPQSDKWGILSATVGVMTVAYALGVLRRRVEAGPDGLRFRTVLRWRRLAWDEILRFEDLRVLPGDPRLHTRPNLRVVTKLRSGAIVWLPVPYFGADGTQLFEAQLAQLRALRRRYSRSTPAQ